MTKTIEASGLTTFEVDPDGDGVTLNMVQPDDTPASLRLPFVCLTQLLMTLPDIQTQALRARHRDPTLRITYPVGPWTLEASNDPLKLILTLTTVDGFKASFALAAQDVIEMGRTASQTSGACIPVLPH